MELRLRKQRLKDALTQTREYETETQQNNFLADKRKDLQMHRCTKKRLQRQGQSD